MVEICINNNKYQPKGTEGYVEICGSGFNPLYPTTMCALLNPWTSATTVTCCFPQKMVTCFLKKNQKNSAQT